MQIEAFVQAVLDEDIGRGDLFAKVATPIPKKAKIIAKSSGVLSGVVYANTLAKMMNFEILWSKNDGNSFNKGEVIAIISGDSVTLLQVERTLLNMVLHSSSIATLTRAYVEKLAPYNTVLLDTRKTRPMLRAFEKYSVRMGGGQNHRMGLDDALMLKDTHLKAIDDLATFIAQARKQIPFTSTIEVECETLTMAEIAMEAKADIVMCDNMTPEELQIVVDFRNINFPNVRLEASGNINLETVEAYAQTGVDAISTGSTVHQSQWIDLSMKMD
jgi:nicotinate-nucleotide pyrophosphorylase (carboxylating)